MYEFRTFGKHVSGPIGTGPDTPVKVIGGIEENIRKLCLTILRLDRIDGGRTVDVVYTNGAGQLGVSEVKETCEGLGIEWPETWMEEVVAVAQTAGDESPEKIIERHARDQAERSRTWFESNGHENSSVRRAGTPTVERQAAQGPLHKGGGDGKEPSLQMPTEGEDSAFSGPNDVRLVSMGLFDPEGLETRVKRAVSTMDGFAEAVHSFYQTGLPPKSQRLAVRMLSLGLLTDKQRLEEAIACTQKGGNAS